MTYVQDTHYPHFTYEKIKSRIREVNTFSQNHTVFEREGQD